MAPSGTHLQPLKKVFSVIKCGCKARHGAFPPALAQRFAQLLLLSSRTLDEPSWRRPRGLQAPTLVSSCSRVREDSPGTRKSFRQQGIIDLMLSVPVTDTVTITSAGCWRRQDPLIANNHNNYMGTPSSAMDYSFWGWTMILLLLSHAAFYTIRKG